MTARFLRENCMVDVCKGVMDRVWDMGSSKFGWVRQGGRRCVGERGIVGGGIVDVGDIR
jgi:hypothetical protein